jgi:proteic killer suppression protein
MHNPPHPGEVLRDGVFADTGITVTEFAKRLGVTRVALRRKLLYLHQAKRLDDLKVPPGNRLEALKGDRKGQHSIRINDQWRICFVWKDGEVFDVEIVDYH